VQCVVPADGLSLDHTHWVQSRGFLLPLSVPRRVFRGKFVAGLQMAKQRVKSAFQHSPAPLLWGPDTPGSAEGFRFLVEATVQKGLGGLPNQPFGGPEHVLQCLNGHIHGVAISNHRLVCLRYAG